MQNYSLSEELRSFLDQYPPQRKLPGPRSSSHQSIFEEIRTLTSFLPNSTQMRYRVWYIRNDVTELPKCSVCGENPAKLKASGEVELIPCSPLCSSRSEERKKKTAATNISKYGVTNPNKLPSVRDKIAKTNMKKYGASSWLGSEERKTMKNQWSSLSHLDKTLRNAHWMKEQHHDLHKGAQEIANDLNVTIRTVYQWLKIHGITHKRINVSASEKELQSFCLSLDSGFVFNDRSSISPMELDVLHPSKKLAIEFNGLYWHSFNDQETADQKRTHLRKTEASESAGIQLLHIFEHEWQNPQKRSIWESMIETKFGASSKTFRASKLDLVQIDHTRAIAFLEENHLQGGCAASHRMALADGDEIICLATFGKPRFTKEADWELIRFACKRGVRVQGGFSRILKNFRHKNPGKIISYADRRYSTGNVYHTNGFRWVRNSEPNYWWWKPNAPVLLPRYKTQKHKLHSLLGESFDPEQSESQNMFRCGYRRIWDCGNSVWLLV